MPCRIDMARAVRVLACWLVVACGPSTRLLAQAVESPDPRRVTRVLKLAATGVSEPMDFTVPPNTRSLTVVAVGSPRNLYALASLQTSDTVEHVQLDVHRSHGIAMEENYYDEQVGLMPGSLYQNIRLGTFTHVYPYAPGQSLPSGPSRLRIVSNDVESGEVTVTLLMPPEDGALTLHVNVIIASDDPETRDRALSFLPAAKAIFAQAGVRVVVDEVRALMETTFSRITEWSEPQETPESQLARLARAGRALVASDALNIFFVDALPHGVYGLSLGTPGPPVGSSYYNGVVLRQTGSDDLAALVFAHEVAHFLGLQHLVDESPSGKRHFDPLPDTESGQKNLMDRTGTALTPGQVFVLRRSALLRVD